MEYPARGRAADRADHRRSLRLRCRRNHPDRVSCGTGKGTGTSKDSPTTAGKQDTEQPPGSAGKPIGQENITGNGKQQSESQTTGKAEEAKPVDDERQKQLNERMGYIGGELGKNPNADPQQVAKYLGELSQNPDAIDAVHDALRLQNEKGKDINAQIKDLEAAPPGKTDEEEKHKNWLLAILKGIIKAGLSLAGNTIRYTPGAFIEAAKVSQEIDK